MWPWIKSTIITPVANFFSGIVASIRNFFASDQQRAEHQPLLQEVVTRTLLQQDKIESTDEQKNGPQSNPSQLTNSLGDLPGEILLVINDHLPSAKDKAHSASVNRHWHALFQPEIGKNEAREAAEYAINPTKENIEKLKALLEVCPMLLLHPVIVKNRHGKMIKGTVYQIALHEGDNELIDDVIDPAFKKLHVELETMEAQRQAWLPEGWMEAEERACANALTAIDNVFAAFKSASNLNHVTEIPQYPYTITINHQGAKEALEAFRKAIDMLYRPTDEVITSGRDPIIRLIARFIDRYKENYDVLGGDNTPRNNALMRAVFGYCQRFAPINFMQAFAMGIYYIVEMKEKLIRSFAYRHRNGHSILPVDSDPLFRLGYEYCGNGGGVYRHGQLLRDFTKFFVNQKQQLLYNPALCNPGKTVAQ